jgi:hypothetical protein
MAAGSSEHNMALAAGVPMLIGALFVLSSSDLAAAVNIRNRSFAIRVEVEIPGGGFQGVISLSMEAALAGTPSM